MSTVTVTQHHHSLHMLNPPCSNTATPHGLGLLTTVASLPPKYRSRYLNIKTKNEIPLDLSVKPISPQIANDVPIATAFTEVYTEPSSEPEDVEPQHTSTNIIIGKVPATVTITKIAKHISRPITPPLTPIKRKYSSEMDAEEAKQEQLEGSANTAKLVKAVPDPTKLAIKRESTPNKPIKSTDSAPKTVKALPPITKLSKNKATRKLKFDEETSSPVSGTIIRPLEDITDGSAHYNNGDIDPKYNIVEITEETKAELAAIKNVIGDYICKLCRLKFEDAFGLARHRCACIVLLEYRCPECGKQFNCPANLASHRRWHKPKKESAGGSGSGGPAAAKKENRNTMNKNTTATAARSMQSIDQASKKTGDLAYACAECGKKFKRQAYLRKHQLTHTNGGAKNTAAATKYHQEDAEGLASVTAFAQTQSSYHSYAGSSTSSLHSAYSTAHDDEGCPYPTVNGYDYDNTDTLSESSTSSAGYGRLQIVETGLTEEENIAAAALTNLRNCASVIQHTTLAH